MVSNLRVLVDPQLFAFGRCGMVRYFSTLCTGLAARGHTVRVPLVLSGSEFLRGWFGWVDRSAGAGAGGRTLAFFYRVADYASKVAYRHFLRAGNFDVLLVTSPTFEDGFLALLNGLPFVMVVHDTMRGVLAPDGFFDPAGGRSAADHHLHRDCRHQDPDFAGT